MSKLSKIAAFSVASIMAVSMAGCSDMSKIMTIDGVDVNAGVYINYMLSEYTEQTYSLGNSGSTASNYLNQEIENHEGEKVKLGDYLPDYAYEQTLDLVAVNKQFDKLKLKFSDEDAEEVNTAVKNYMEGMSEEYLTKQGISKDSVTKFFTAEKQKELLFHYYYGADGEKAITDDAIKDYLNNNYIRYKMISVPRTTEATTAASTSVSGETTTTQSAEEQTKASKKADKEAKSIANKYLKIAKENDDFDQVISQYNAETQEPTTAATTTTVATSTTEAATDAQGNTVSTETQETTTSAAEEPKEIHVHFYDQNNEEYGEDTPQKAQTINSGEKAEKPADPEREFYTFDNWYSDANFTSVFDFDQAISSDTSVYAKFSTNENMVSLADEETASDLSKHIRESIKKFEQPVLYKDDNNYYVIVKYDPTKRTDYMINGDNYENILTEMKYEEYEGLIKDWEKDFKIKKNEKAFEKYTPSKIEEIYNDFIAENNNSNV